MTKKKVVAKVAVKAKAKPAPKVKHERGAKQKELEMLERGRNLAVSYLEQRDGMDPQIALDVIESMSPEEVNELIHEANSAVLDRPVTEAASAVVEQALGGDVPVASGNGLGAVLVEATEPGKDFPDFVTIEALVADAIFPELVQECVDLARTKNDAEKLYKVRKKELIYTLNKAGTKLVSVLGIKLERYTGSAGRHLDDIKLMEKGVSIDVINQCWVATEYEDVRITAPKEK